MSDGYILKCSVPSRSNPNPNPNPNGLFSIAALMLDYNNNGAVDITAKSHYDDYQLTTHNSSEKNN